MVILDPSKGEGAGAQAAASTTGATSGSQGGGVNTPAKIDPLLPGVFHPSQRGTPGLDTIDETVNPGAAAQQQAGGSSGQQQGSAAVAGAPQGQSSGSTGGGSGQGDGVVGGSAAAASGEGDGDGLSPSRRPSYAAALMAGSPEGEAGGEQGDGTGHEAGSGEQGGDTKTAEGSGAHGAGGASQGEGSHGPPVEAEEVQQQGKGKIPGNPPFEIDDDDEDVQENDMSHPEGFLRAMPEDESLMRVLQLPDGRVQRREEEDEEEEEKAAGVAAAAAEAAGAAVAAAAAAGAALAAAAAANGDTPAADAERPVVVKAPSSAQAPPLSSGLPTPSTSSEVLAAAAAAAPAMQAPRPPTADPAVFYSAGGRHKPSVSVDAALAGGVIPGTMFPAIGGENAPAAAAGGILLSDPGLSVGPAVALQRARSFSPRERVPEAPLHSVASMPPMIPAPTMPAPVAPIASPPMTPAPTVPAPSFPAPRPPSGNVQFVDKHPARADGVQPPDVLGTGNGPGSGGQQVPSPHRGMGEGEKPHVSSQQSDQELQELLSGRANGGAGRLQTEIKIANLQGPEQEIMRLVMHTHVEGRLQEVEFDFNLDQDHPEQVRPSESSFDGAELALTCFMVVLGPKP